MVTEEQSREAKLGEANGRLHPVRDNELEQLIKKLRKEKEEIECRLLSDKERIEKELHEHKKTEMRIKLKNESLTVANENSLQKIKELENKNKALVTKNRNLLSQKRSVECETSESEEPEAELNRLSIELEQLRKQNKSLKNENADFVGQIKDLEKRIKALETTNKNLLSKIKSEAGEKTECDKVKAELKSLKKENADSLQKIKDLETKNNSLESKLKTKECEIEQHRKEYNRSIAKVNADSLLKIEDLEKNINVLEKKNERFRKKLGTIEWVKLQNDRTRFWSCPSFACVFWGTVSWSFRSAIRIVRSTCFDVNRETTCPWKDTIKSSLTTLNLSS